MKARRAKQAFEGRSNLRTFTGTNFRWESLHH
jgi:hypothetical protein